jgi:hypothetical protein
MALRFIIGLLLLVVSASAFSRVDNFLLLDDRGTARELYYHGDAPAIVLASHSAECASTRKDSGKLEKLARTHGKSGVVFYYLDPVDQRDAFAKRDGAIPVLLDETQIVTRSFGITRAGEVLLIDPKTWEITYRGAANELDEALAGKKVKSQPYRGGCELALAPVATDISYSKTIAPLLEEKCTVCHRPGGIGPWAMTSYDMVRGFAPMMREVLRTRRMPPWHADPHIGAWNGDRSLTNDQIRTLVQWIEGGAPRGDGHDILTGVKADDGGWPLGKPDLVVELPPFDVPVTGVVDYQFPSVANPLDRDVWVRAASIAAGDRAVVHHVLAGSIPEGMPTDEMDNVFENYLIGYAPGAESMVYPEDTGVFVPKGGHFTFQLHYTPVGRPARDVTRLALYFHDTPPKEILRHHVIVNPRLSIPANDPAHPETAYFPFHKDAILYSVFPHAHYRGRSSSFTLELPDGARKVLLSVPRYDFNWQREYAFTQPVSVPAGSKLIHTTVYDNSKQNPGNPDPNVNVRWGLQSADEMLYGAMMFRWADETSAAPTHDKERDDVAQMYGFMDRDMDGRLVPEEMPQRMRERFGENFARVDANADGGLDIEEFIAASRQRVSDRQ